MPAVARIGVAPAPYQQYSYRTKFRIVNRSTNTSGHHHGENDELVRSSYSCRTRAALGYPELFTRPNLVRLHRYSYQYQYEHEPDGYDP
eukprot:scaffold342503_cov17-Prasinocladus_malaysianus.AAC.1